MVTKVYDEYHKGYRIEENKQDICDVICEALRHTSAAGSEINNALKEIRYVVDDNGNEYAVPIFENGNGEPNMYSPHGYYAVNITGSSGIGMWIDITEHFVRKMW